MNSRIISALMLSAVLYTTVVAEPYIYVINTLKYESRWEKDPVTGHEVKKGSPGVLIVDINASTTSSDKENKKVNPGKSEKFDLKSNLLESITIEWDNKKFTDKKSKAKQANAAISYMVGGKNYVYIVTPMKIFAGQAVEMSTNIGDNKVKLLGEYLWSNPSAYNEYSSPKTVYVKALL